MLGLPSHAGVMRRLVALDYQQKRRLPRRSRAERRRRRKRAWDLARRLVRAGGHSTRICRLWWC